MEQVLSFARDYYIVFTIITVILLFALVGYLSQKWMDNGKGEYRLRKLDNPLEQEEKK